MGTLQGLYFEKMIGSSSSNFTNIVTIGELIENGVKSGNIACTIPQPEVTESMHPQLQTPMDLVSYYPYPYISTAQYQQPLFQYQPQNQNQQPAQA